MFGAELAGNLADQPVDMPFDAEDLREALPDGLRQDYVEYLEASGQIPAGTPSSSYTNIAQQHLGAGLFDPYQQFQESALTRAMDHEADSGW